MKLASLIAFLLFRCVPLAAAPLAIGWGSADITPETMGAICGASFPRTAKGVRDPLKATALAISQGDEAVVFLTLDALAIHPGPEEALRNEVAARIPGFPVEKLIVNCTHTHAGGSLYPFEPKHPEKGEYARFCARRAAEAVAAAWKDRKPGSVAWGYTPAFLGWNRRVVYFHDRSGVDPDPITARRKVLGNPINGRGVMYGENTPYVRDYKKNIRALSGKKDNIYHRRAVC